MTAIRYIVAVCVLALGVGSAQASVVQQFRLDGINQDGSHFIVGSVLVDTMAGEIDDFFLESAPRESNLGEFEVLDFFKSGNVFGYSLFDSRFSGSLVKLSYTLEGDLVAYMGGNFHADLFVAHSSSRIYAGIATQMPLPPEIEPPPQIEPPAEVPLPAAFPLFLTALVSLLVLGIRRVRG